MRTAQQWLQEYGASHQHPTNKLLHWLCVPPIVLTVVGLLWALPVPSAFHAASPWLNWATIAIAATVPAMIVGHEIRDRVHAEPR